MYKMQNSKASERLRGYVRLYIFQLPILLLLNITIKCRRGRVVSASDLQSISESHQLLSFLSLRKNFYSYCLLPAGPRNGFKSDSTKYLLFL